MLAALSGLVAISAQPAFVVRPYYVYPSDQRMHSEYVRAIEKLVVEVQDWYRAKAGVTFRLATLEVVKGEDYLSMRAGPNPTEEDRKDIQRLPAWWDSLQRIVKGPKPNSVAWVFAQGGGGFAGANLWGEYQGFATFGDWVLEPISGVREPAAIHSGFASWQVQGGTPKGTTVHELGHAFGLHHPDKYPGKTIMRWHGDYPGTGLLPHEVMILRTSPFFVPDAFDADGPWLDFENTDACRQGSTIELRGRRFKDDTEIEFRWVEYPSGSPESGRPMERSLRIAAEVRSDTLARVKVPANYGAGCVRAWNGKKKGNTVPINGYPDTIERAPPLKEN
jgi:hypothetical protein